MVRLNYREGVEGYMKERPKTVDLTSSSTLVYLRRNIEKVPTLDEDGFETGLTHWRYDEATLSPEEYEEYLNIIQSPDIEMIMQTLSDLQLAVDEL